MAEQVENEKMHGRDFVRQLNGALKEHKYTDDVFKGIYALFRNPYSPTTSLPQNSSQCEHSDNFVHVPFPYISPLRDL